MKKDKLLILLLSLCVVFSSPLFISCASDDKDTFVEGDTTELKKELNAAYDSIANASSADYKQETIDNFKKKVDLIQEVVDKGNVSLQEVTNMRVHLKEALERFLNDKMIGIPTEALIAGWNFDEGTGTSLVGDGFTALTAKLKSGPSEIFSTST